MTQWPPNPTSGVVALMTAMILSFALMIVTVTLNQSAFMMHTSVRETEYKKQSASLARSCIGTALLSIATNPDYAGNETKQVGEHTCHIHTVQRHLPTAGQYTIKAQASFHESATHVQTTISPDLSILTWQELPSF